MSTMIKGGIVEAVLQ